MTSYSQRRNLFEKVECVWSVQPGGIGLRDHTGATSLARWTDISAVRVAFAPTGVKPWRHLFEVRMADGARWIIDNVHFRGLADFENRSDAYAPFVRAALTRIAVMGPQARARLGAGPAGYGLSLAFVLLTFCALAMILLLVPIEGAPGVAWVKLAIIAFSIPALFAWAIKARPRGVEVGAIPDSALPATSKAFS